MFSTGTEGVALLTLKRIGQRTRVPGAYQPRRFHAPTKRATLETCPQCQGAFLHFRNCGLYVQADRVARMAHARKVALARWHG